jgi:hypothetical protein
MPLRPPRCLSMQPVCQHTHTHTQTRAHLLNQRTSSISSSCGVGCCSRRDCTASHTSATLRHNNQQAAHGGMPVTPLLHNI